MNKESGPSFSGYTGERKISTWLIATIVVLIILAIGSGIFAYVHYTSFRQQTVKTPGSGSSTGATGTPLVSMNATQLYQYVTHKTPVLADPLDGSQIGNWDNGPGCLFKQKAFYLTVSPSLSTAICFLRNEFVRNFAFQVQVQFGPTTDLGEQQGCAIFFRAHLVQQEGYGFNMSISSRLNPITGLIAANNTATLAINKPENPPIELKG